MNSNETNRILSLLRDQHVLVVGGDRRDSALGRLQSGLGLGRVDHCRTRKTDASPRSFAARLREPGVFLVVWVLGLSRTHHGKYLHRACRALGIPWVDCGRIPHPSALLDRIERLRLSSALERRRERIEMVA